MFVEMKTQKVIFIGFCENHLSLVEDFWFLQKGRKKKFVFFCPAPSFPKTNLK